MNTEPTSSTAKEPPPFLMDAAPKQDLALSLSQRAAAVLKAEAVKAKIKEAVAESATITAVIDPDGRAQAHRAGMVLMKLRTGIKAVGKSAREDAQAFSKAVITAENELIDLVVPEEDRIFALRDGYDEQERIKEEARANAERERIAKIETALSAMRALPPHAVGKPASEIANALATIKADAMSADVWQEYHARALEVRDEVVAQLEQAHAGQLAVEQETARVKAEQEAEALRVQVQAAENMRVALELKQQKEARDQEEKLRLQELERVQAELRAAQERLDADRKAFEAQQKAAADKAAADEAERIEAEKRAALAEVIDTVEITEVPADPAPRDEAHLRVMVDRQMTFDPVNYGVVAIDARPDGDPAMLQTSDVVDATLPLSFAYDEIADVLTVEGINYAGDMFRKLSGDLECGATVQIIDRGDNVFMIYRP